MRIVAPYFEKEKPKEYSSIDRVERGGYIPNDKKIETFIESGLSLVQMHRGTGEYEINEEESDFDEDSPEFLDELQKQAEEFTLPPLMQFVDKISAEEVLDSADKALREAEIELSEKKHKRSEKDATKSLVEALERNSNALERHVNAKAEDEPK